MTDSQANSDPKPMTTPQPLPADPATAGTDVRRRRARRELDAQDDVPHSPVARSSPERASKALANAIACARIADDNKAKEILVLDLRQATALVDFFVIATAPSRRQSQAIAEETDQEMKRRGERKLGIEGAEEGKWTLIDYGDFVVHIFSPESRTYYGLEEIWGDATRIPWQEEATPPADTTAPAPTPADAP